MIGKRATSRSRKAIAASATPEATTVASIVGPAPPLALPASLSSYAPAASSAGIPSRNDSRVADTRSRPRSRPAEIVAPERLTPGTSARHWARPMTSPSVTVSERSARSCAARRSASTKTALNTIRPSAMTTRRVSIFLMTSLSANPTTPIGSEPTSTANAKRNSGSRRPLLLTPPTRPLMRATMSLAKYRTAARIAPTCTTAVNPMIPSFSCCVFRSAEQLLDDQQVRGAGHRQELCDPLDHTEYNGLQDVQGFPLQWRRAATAAATPRR